MHYYCYYFIFQTLNLVKCADCVQTADDVISYRSLPPESNQTETVSWHQQTLKLLSTESILYFMILNDVLAKDQSTRAKDS